MAVRRVPTEERYFQPDHQTAVGLHSQDGRTPAEVFNERHVSNAQRPNEIK